MGNLRFISITPLSGKEFVHDLVRRHLGAGEEAEALDALSQQHAYAADGGPDAGGLGLDYHAGLLGVVDGVADDEVAPEEALIYERLPVQRSHADLGGVDEYVAIFHGLSEGLGVEEVGDAGLAARDALGELLHGELGVGIEGVALAVEDAYLARAVEGALHGDGGGRAAGAEDDHLCALDVDAVYSQVGDEAEAVGVVAGQRTVALADDAVARADELAGRAQAVEVLRDLGLAGHGDVKAARVEEPEGRDGLAGLFQRHVVGEVGAVYAEALKAVVVHGRGAAVADGAADEAVHPGVSVYDAFHLYFLLIRRPFRARRP